VLVDLGIVCVGVTMRALVVADNGGAVSSGFIRHTRIVHCCFVAADDILVVLLGGDHDQVVEVELG